MNKRVFTGLTLGIIAATLIAAATIATTYASLSGIDKAKKAIEESKSSQTNVKDIVKKFLDKADGGHHHPN